MWKIAVTDYHDMHIFSLKYTIANRQGRLRCWTSIDNARRSTDAYLHSILRLCMHVALVSTRRWCSVVLMLGHRQQLWPTLDLHLFGVCWWRVQTFLKRTWPQQTNLYAKSAALLETNRLVDWGQNSRFYWFFFKPVYIVAYLKNEGGGGAFILGKGMHV